MACRCDKVWLDLCEKMAQKIHRSKVPMGHRRRPARETVTAHCEICHRRYGLSFNSLPDLTVRE